MQVRVRALLCALLVALPLLVPMAIWMAPSPFESWGHHSLDWWVANTPRCVGPICYNAFYDHGEVSFRLPVP